MLSKAMQVAHVNGWNMFVDVHVSTYPEIQMRLYINIRAPVKEAVLGALPVYY